MPLWVFNFLQQLITVWTVLLFIRILMSWIAPRANWYQQPWQTLYALTEPVMSPFRALIPPIGGIDFSPMIVFFVLNLVKNLLAILANQFAA